MIIFKKPRCTTSENGVVYIFDMTYNGNPLYVSFANKEESTTKKDILKKMTEQNIEKIKEISSQFCTFSSPYFSNCFCNLETERKVRVSKNYTSDYFMTNVKHIIENCPDNTQESILLSPHSILTFIPHSIQMKNKTFFILWTFNQETITFDIEQDHSNTAFLEEYDIHKINTVCTEETPISLYSKNKSHKLKKLKLRAKLLSIKAQKALEAYEAYKNKEDYYSDTSNVSTSSIETNNS